MHRYIKNISIFVITALVSAGLFVPAGVYAQTQATDMSGQLASIQQSAGTLQYEASTVCPSTWNRNLGTWDRGSDVMRLQRFLNANPQTRLAEYGPGSPGQETSFYGIRTKSAVARFQQIYRYNIILNGGQYTASGEFDQQTRVVANNICTFQHQTTDGGSSIGSDGSGDDPTREALQNRLLALQTQFSQLQSQRIDQMEGRVSDLESRRSRDTTGGSSRGGSRVVVGTEGRVEGTSISMNSNRRIREDQEASIGEFRFTARDSDITLERVDILFEAENQYNERRPWRLIKHISLYRGGTRVEIQPADRESYWSEVGDDAYRFRISDKTEVEEDDSARFSISVKTRTDIDSSDIPQDYRTAFASGIGNDDAIRLVDDRGVQHYLGDYDAEGTVVFTDGSGSSGGGSGGSGGNTSYNCFFGGPSSPCNQ